MQEKRNARDASRHNQFVETLRAVDLELWANKLCQVYNEGNTDNLG